MTPEEQLTYYQEGSCWGDLTWHLVEKGKLARAQAQLGTYSLELQPGASPCS